MKCPVGSKRKMADDHQKVTQFRPCIDLHDGKVKQVCFQEHCILIELKVNFSPFLGSSQIVGGTLTDNEGHLQTNFIAR